VRSASLSPGGFLQSRAMEEDSEVPSSLPASQCLNSSSPLRPEDVEERDTAAVQEDSPIKRSRNSFRPGTFAEAECSPRPDAEKRQIQTGVDIHGEKPGLVPWRIFFVNTVFLACAWEAAALEAMIKSFQSNMIFHQSMKIATYGLQPGQVLPLPALFGSRVETNWQNGLNHPRGLVCDSTGTNFVTSARAPDGNDGFVTGRLSLLGSHRSLGVDFGPASPCSGGGQLGGQSVQDLSSISCTSDGCIASVLPRRGTQLVRCSTANQGTNATGKNATGVQIGPRPQLALSAVPLSRAWLDDRGGIAEDSSDESPLALHPEEIASAVTFPCGNSSLSGMQRTTPSECMAVSTTAKRLVALELANMAPQGPTWTPTAVLSKGMGEVPEPGELAVVGNRYLVTLRTQKGVLEAMDLQRGGASVGSWRLSASAAPGQRWGPICAAGGALFVLEDGQNPGLWRFQTPPELQAQLAR